MIFTYSKGLHRKETLYFSLVLLNLFSSSLWISPLEGKWQKCFISVFTSVFLAIKKGRLTGWAVPFVKFVKEWVSSTFKVQAAPLLFMKEFIYMCVLLLDY